MNGMQALLVLFALALTDPVPPTWEQALAVIVPELAERYEAPIRVDPRRRDSEDGATLELAAEELRHRLSALETRDIEAVNIDQFVNCKHYFSLPPGLVEADPEAEARCIALGLDGTVFMFSDPFRADDGWRVNVSVAGGDFMGETFVVIARGDDEWRFVEFGRGFVINYF